MITEVVGTVAILGTSAGLAWLHDWRASRQAVKAIRAADVDELVFHPTRQRRLRVASERLDLAPARQEVAP
jgi:uncharacterized membrane protein